MRIGKRKGSKPGMVILRTLKILRVSVPNSCDIMFCALCFFSCLIFVVWGIFHGSGKFCCGGAFGLTLFGSFSISFLRILTAKLAGVLDGGGS